MPFVSDQSPAWKVEIQQNQQESDLVTSIKNLNKLIHNKELEFSRIQREIAELNREVAIGNIIRKKSITESNMLHDELGACKLSIDLLKKELGIKNRLKRIADRISGNLKAKKF